jgi:hypothetical protein
MHGSPGLLTMDGAWHKFRGFHLMMARPQINQTPSSSRSDVAVQVEDEIQ